MNQIAQIDTQGSLEVQFLNDFFDLRVETNTDLDIMAARSIESVHFKLSPNTNFLENLSKINEAAIASGFNCPISDRCVTALIEKLGLERLLMKPPLPTEVELILDFPHTHDQHAQTQVNTMSRSEYLPAGPLEFCVGAMLYFVNTGNTPIEGAHSVRRTQIDRDSILEFVWDRPTGRLELNLNQPGRISCSISHAAMKIATDISSSWSAN